MPTVTELPCELVAVVLGRLDNVSDLLPAILTCRHLHLSLQETPRLIDTVLRRQMAPELLPYAIAVHILSSQAKSLTEEHRRSVLDTLYDGPVQLTDLLRSLSLSQALHIGSMHDTIHRLAAEFSQQAWALLSSEELAVSNSEHTRFLRAFYRYELLCLLMQAIPRNDEYISRTPQGPKKDLLARHAPWEYEQIVCAYDFLKGKFGDAIREVLAHDVDFGEFSIDYLSRGDRAHWVQQRLSKGLQFIDRLIRTPSYDEKWDMLRAELDGGKGSATIPWDQLCLETNDDASQDDGMRLQDFPAEELERLICRPHGQDDLDSGPEEVWRQQHYDLPRTAFVMFAENSGYRDRAYVFWDKMRLGRGGVLGRPYEIPAREEVSVRGEEWEVMERSWGERSKVWQKGGSGYWKDGDLSGIEWPRKRSLEECLNEGSTDVAS